MNARAQHTFETFEKVASSMQFCSKAKVTTTINDYTLKLEQDSDKVRMTITKALARKEEITVGGYIQRTGDWSTRLYFWMEATLMKLSTK